MKNYIIIIIAVMVLTSCRSHKETAVEITALTDTISMQKQYMAVSVSDSLFRHLELSFDTLEAYVDVASADTSDRPRHNVRLRAVRGRLSTGSDRHTGIEVKSMSNDSISVSRRMHDAERSRSETDAVTTPPDGTKVLVCIVLAFAIIYYLCRRR